MNPITNDNHHDTSAPIHLWCLHAENALFAIQNASFLLARAIHDNNRYAAYNITSSLALNLLTHADNIEGINDAT